MNKQANDIINKIKVEENQSRKRMFLYSSVPLIFTIILIFISWFSVNKANEKVIIADTKVNELNHEIHSLEEILKVKTDSIKELQKVYEFAVNYRDQRFKFSYSIDKALFSRYPQQTRMLSDVRDMISDNRIKWNLGGNSIENGFDSPSFAAFMLNKYSKTQVPRNEIYKLFEFLEKTNKPKVGDIIFFEYGYTMFYFEYNNKPFCVGMTPVGVSSLNLNFGPKILGYGIVEY